MEFCHCSSILVGAECITASCFTISYLNKEELKSSSWFTIIHVVLCIPYLAHQARALDCGSRAATVSSCPHVFQNPGTRLTLVTTLPGMWLVDKHLCQFEDSLAPLCNVIYIFCMRNHLIGGGGSYS